MSGHKGLTPTLTPSIVGTAEENAKVDIYVDNKLVASVDVDKDGNWSYEFKDNELSEGENSIKVVAVDKAGNKNETTDSIITDTIAPEKPTIELDDSSDSGIKMTALQIAPCQHLLVWRNPVLQSLFILDLNILVRSLLLKMGHGAIRLLRRSRMANTI